MEHISQKEWSTKRVILMWFEKNSCIEGLINIMTQIGGEVIA